MLIAIVLTYNESAHLAECIESVRFADRVIVFDSFSTDTTVEIARAHGAEVIQRQFDDYAGQRNAALAAARDRGARWVLFVDADERVTSNLQAEILARIADRESSVVGYKIPRHNMIFGVLTRGAGWYPDHQMRLLKVGFAQYDPARKVHEVVLLDGAEGELHQPFIHYNYQDVKQFHAKQKRYSAYDARILFEQGIRAKPQNYILQPLRHFWWRFVTLKGYQDGVHGFRLSALMAWYELRKYVLLRRLWKQG